MLISCMMMIAGLDSMVVENIPNIESFSFENCWYRDAGEGHSFTAKGTVVSTSSTSSVYLIMDVNSKCRIASQKLWSVPANKELDPYIPALSYKLKANWKNITREYPELCP